MVKKIIWLSLISLMFLSACTTEKLNEEEAQARVEKLLKDLSENNYNHIGTHFTAEFNKNEPVEKKIEKYQQLKSVLGDLNSVELVSSTSEANFGEQARVQLQYRIHYANATTLEDFTVVKDEGEYRIASHHIKNE